jgi:hypothetical protein
VRILSEHHRSSPWSVRYSKWSLILNHWNPWRIVSFKKQFQAGEIGPSVWSPPGAGQTTNLCSRAVWPPASISGWSDCHQGRSDRQPLQQSIFFNIVSLPSWWSDRELYYGLTARCIESSQRLVFGVWAINTHPSHARLLSWPFQ